MLPIGLPIMNRSEGIFGRLGNMILSTRQDTTATKEYAMKVSMISMAFKYELVARRRVALRPPG
jgi:hypothetical protein